MSLEIKTASEADAALIEALAREIWNQHYVGIISKEQIAYMLHKNQSAQAIAQDMHNGTVYEIAYWNGEACGYSAASPDSDALFLSKLYIKQSHRGRGIARALVSRIEARAQQLGVKNICLKCNKHNTGSLAAYKSLGFEIAYPCVTDIGNGYVMDDYALEKGL